VFTGYPQFRKARDVRIILNLLQGKRPQRPSQEDCGGIPMSDTWWNIVMSCLETQAVKRPSMQDILIAIGVYEEDDNVMKSSC
jgi:hypothetical protein